MLKALFNKWRFRTPKGLLNSEQLTELSESDLDILYRSLENKKNSTKGLTGKKDNSDINEKLSLVQAIYNYKRELSEKALVTANNAELRAKLLEAANKVELKELTKGKSSAELRKAASKL